MSDPVKSSEIEDVLASIRRLVSEEARGEMHASRQTPPEPAPRVSEAASDEEPSDALVLTPALRVHEGGKAEPEADAEEPEADEVAAEEPAVEEIVTEAAEVEEDTGAVVEDQADTITEELAAEVAEEAVAAAKDAVEEAGSDLPELPDEAQTLETKIAALEALIATGVEDARAQQVAEAPEEGLSLAGEPALDWEDHSPERAQEDGLGDDVADIEDLSVSVAQPAVEDDMPVEAEEAGPAHDDTSTAPRDEVSAGPEATDPVDPAEQDRSEDDVVGAAENLRSDDPLISEAGDAVTIDEAALRELVIDIVREELQGALGERITRNVRRLVRREIHRALASQELD